jgi:hypothetical protein
MKTLFVRFSVAASLFWTLMALAHPFHVGITEIRLVDSDVSADVQIQVTHKLFRDDVEAASASLGSIEKYVMARFGMRQFVRENEQIIPLKWVGLEYEDDVVWIYLDGVASANFTSITAQNTLLTEWFADQSNLIHWYSGQRTGASTHSDMLYKNETESTYTHP